MPEPQGWTRVEEPSGWTMIEPAKAEAAPEPSLTDAVMADNPAIPAPLRIVGALLRAAKAHPVQAGAMAGGAIAAPFTSGMSLIPAAAAVGGASALGAGAGQLASGQSPDLRTMATEGAAGAVGQGVGAGVAKLAGKVAPMIGKAVLRASPTLQREFDNLVPTFLKERIPVGQSATAGERMRESAATARQMAADAEASGASAVHPREIVKEFRPVRDAVKNRAANARPGADAEMKEIVTRAKGLRSAGPQPVTRNQTLKQSAQADASKAFRAADRGATINDTTAQLDKAVAVGRQKAAEARVPGIKDVNARTQSLMGLEHALENAEMKSASPLGFNPVNWAGAMMPGATSKVAFGIDAASHAPMAGTLRNALIAALMGSEE